MKEEKSDKGKKEYKDRVFPVFGHFPLAKWAEYEKEVEQIWAGCRWAKAWHDHELAKAVSREEAMWNAIMDIKKELEVYKLSKESEEKVEKRITLGE